MAIVCYLLLLVSLSKKHISGVIRSVVETHTSRQFVRQCVLVTCREIKTRHQIIQIIGRVLKGEIASLPS